MHHSFETVLRWSVLGKCRDPPQQHSMPSYDFIILFLTNPISFDIVEFCYLLVILTTTLWCNNMNSHLFWVLTMGKHYELSYFILTSILSWRCYHYPYFTEGHAKSQKLNNAIRFIQVVSGGGWKWKAYLSDLRAHVIFRGPAFHEFTGSWENLPWHSKDWE